MDKCIVTEVSTATGWRKVRLVWSESVGAYFGATDKDKEILFGELIVDFLPHKDKPDTLWNFKGDFQIVQRYGEEFPA